MHTWTCSYIAHRQKYIYTHTYLYLNTDHAYTCSQTVTQRYTLIIKISKHLTWDFCRELSFLNRVRLWNNIIMQSVSVLLLSIKEKILLNFAKENLYTKADKINNNKRRRSAVLCCSTTPCHNFTISFKDYDEANQKSCNTDSISFSCYLSLFFLFVLIYIGIVIYTIMVIPLFRRTTFTEIID